jgi:hypothetical protein
MLRYEFHNIFISILMRSSFISDLPKTLHYSTKRKSQLNFDGLRLSERLPKRVMLPTPNPRSDDELSKKLNEPTLE